MKDYKKAVDELELRVDGIESKPVDTDWNSEDFEYWEVEHCSSCNDQVVTHNGECLQCGNMVESAEGPMMSYLYPVSLDFESAAEKIGSLPLCVVKIDGGPAGLALTGGGMDLSWEICEAFVLIGFYPPIHFSDLPRISGRGQSDRDKLVIEACKQSLRIAIGWHNSVLQRLEETYK